MRSDTQKAVRMKRLARTIYRDLKSAMISIPGMVIVAAVSAGIAVVLTQLEMSAPIITRWGELGAAAVGAATAVVGAIYVHHYTQRRAIIERGEVIRSAISSIAAALADLNLGFDDAGTFREILNKPTKLKRAQRAVEVLKTYQPFSGLHPHILINLNTYVILAAEFFDDVDRYTKANFALDQEHCTEAHLTLTALRDQANTLSRRIVNYRRALQ